MRTTRIGEITEVNTPEEANKLLKEGWNFCKIIPLPNKYAIILVKHVSID